MFKIQVNASEELVERVDLYAKKMGVSRSSLCCMFIGQGIMGFDKSMEIADKLGGSMVDDLNKQTQNATGSPL